MAAELQRTHGGQCVAPDMLHLTLAFLGRVPADRVAGLIALGTCTPMPGCRIVLDRVAAPSSSLTWAEPTLPPAALLIHAARLAERLRTAGYAIEQRAFRPHVTLLRGPSSLPDARPCREMAWTAQRWALLVSERDAQGVGRYRELGGWECGVGGTVAEGE